MDAQIHTHAHTDTQTYIHTNANKQTHTRTHTPTDTHACTHTRTRTHTYTHRETNTHIHTRTHTHTHVYVNACMYVCVSIYQYIYLFIYPSIYLSITSIVDRESSGPGVVLHKRFVCLFGYCKRISIMMGAKHLLYCPLLCILQTILRNIRIGLTPTLTSFTAPMICIFSNHTAHKTGSPGPPCFAVQHAALILVGTSRNIV